MGRLMLDTNALIDLFIARVPETHAAMEQIVMHSAEEEDEVLISSLSLKDASYIIENSRSFKDVIPDRRIRSQMARKLREIAFDTCTICGIDEAIARKAHLSVAEDDFDDALIAECALAYDADAIISSDALAFTSSLVPKMSPQEYAVLLIARGEEE